MTNKDHEDYIGWSILKFQNIFVDTLHQLNIYLSRRLKKLNEEEEKKEKGARDD